MATPTTLPATFVAGNVLQAAQLNDLRGAFRVLQVVATTKTDTWSASIAAGATSDVTGLSVSITPSSASSKILIMAMVTGASVNVGNRASNAFSFQVLRDSTLIGIGNTASNRARITSLAGTYAEWNRHVGNSNAVILDSPNTTSATTYKVRAINAIGVADTVTYYLNRSSDDADLAYVPRGASTILVMEISA